MMKLSKRAKRMDRHHKARKRPGINLVSLMDIFTILVFFLLVNSSSVEQLPRQKDIKLPTSAAAQPARDTLVIFVTPQNILVQGREVAQVSQEVGNDDVLIKGLVDELKFLGSRSRIIADTEATKGGRAITVMGDEQIPYRLLRKILASCREADYTRIAFATMQKKQEGSKS
jgi:biopolymer transport protein ExbD